MTTRLYYTDSYLTSFSAAVIEAADSGRRVYLDQSAFYPSSGGQPHDLGTLGGIPVIDVIEEEERVAHLLAAPLMADRASGVVDWPRRFDHMQQHTGQHLLSAVLAEGFGAPTVSVHFGAAASTLDLETGPLSPDQLRQAEASANVVITEDRPVTVGFEDAATVAGLRKASQRAGQLRIVTIADLDRSACGGTHVRATGEIGALLIRKVERVKRLLRLEFLCGARAIRRARADFDLLSGVAAGSSAGIDEVPGVVEGLRDQLKVAQAASRTLADRVNSYRAAELVARVGMGPDGIRRILEQPPGATVEELRGLAQAVTAHPGVLFAGVVAQPATLLLASSADAGLDAGALLREILGKLGGRGGGTTRMAQGGLPSLAELPAALRTLGFG
jgi:alanyl-tRNA synthetase